MYKIFSKLLIKEWPQAEFIKFAQERKTFSIIHIKNIAQTY